jgi:hypothetical protein
MIWVPLNGVNRKIVVLVGLLVLARVSLRAQMDHALLRADKEQMVLVRVEVKAHTAGETVHERLLLSVSLFFVVVLDKFKLHDFLCLKLVLQQVPICYAAITGYRVETQILSRVVFVPAHLPDGVGMLVGAHSRVVDRLATVLGADVKDHYSAVVAACSNQGRVVGVEIDAADT